VALAVLALVFAVAISDGGYFEESWPWIVIVLSSAAGIALLTRAQIVLGVLELAVFAALSGLVAWVGLSAAWSVSSRASIDELERDLIYVAAFVALPLVVDQERVRNALGGLTSGIALVVGYALGERLLFTDALVSDPVGGTRLVEPIGYANALGILSAMATVLALGFAANGHTRLERSLGAAGPILFLSALALTQSRGAWIALAVGLACWAFFETERARFLATAVLVAPPAVAAVVATERSSALTVPGSTPAELEDAGLKLAVTLVLLAVVAALVSFGARSLEVRVPRQLTWISLILLPALLGAMALATTIRPRRSLDVRLDYWSVAWNQFEDNPLLGSGAGTFVRFWERSGIAAGVRDAHSVYLETLAELGPLGLTLLLLALGLPLLAALRARRRPFVGVALGAYVAFLVHAGLDWDWEMPVVMLAGIVCAVALLVSARFEGRTFELGVTARCGILLGVLGLATLGLVMSVTGE
jgi:O-antigen ligase